MSTKIWGAAALLAASMFVSAGALAQPCATQPVTVGFLPKLDTDPYFQVARQGAEEAQGEIGGKVVQQAPSQATAEAMTDATERSILRVRMTSIWAPATIIKSAASIAMAVRFEALNMRGLITATGIVTAAMAQTRPSSRLGRSPPNRDTLPAAVVRPTAAADMALSAAPKAAPPAP